MLLLMTSLSASAFNQKVDTIVVSHDNYQTLQVIVTIDNTDSEALWIWYDSHDYGKDYQKAIKHYLMKRKGDFSIFDIGTDPNMFGEWWHPYGPKDFFVKHLESNKSFSIVLYKDIAPSVDHTDYNDSISSIKIFSNKQIKETCPGIEEPYSVNRISFPHNVIAFQIPD